MSESAPMPLLRHDAVYAPVCALLPPVDCRPPVMPFCLLMSPYRVDSCLRHAALLPLLATLPIIIVPTSTAT